MEPDEKRLGDVESDTSDKMDAEAIEKLRRLREKLLSDDISAARVAGHNLSWMQEDGLAILKEVLFGDYSRNAKKAAAYGLRRMHGRMKKMATEVLKQGLEHRDRTTQEACSKSLGLMEGKIGRKAGSGRQRIEEVRAKRRPRTQSPRRKRPQR